jgi:hypothetical protein
VDRWDAERLAQIPRKKLSFVPIVALLQNHALAIEFDVPKYSLSVSAVRVYWIPVLFHDFAVI